MQIVTLRDDTMFSIRSTDPKAWIQRHWVYGSFYEEVMLAYIALQYRGGTFIDVGASVGNHTVFFAKMCASHVYAIEPVPESYDHMLENVAINHLQTKVTGYRCAVGDKVQNGQMRLPEDGNEGMWKFDASLGEVAVRMVPLDSLKIDGPVTLLKIDAECCEASVLRGALGLITEHYPVIFAEAATPPDLQEITKFLAPLGYFVGAKFNSTPTYEFRVQP